MRALISTVISILYGYSLFFLETLEKESCSEEDVLCLLKNIVFSNKIGASLALLLFYLVFLFVSQRHQFRRKRRLVKAFLDNFIQDNLNRNTRDNRITIFEKTWGFQFFPKYVYYTLTRFYFYWKNNCLGYRLACFPNPFRKYLEIYARVGHPNNSIRDTFFLVPRNETEINGFVAHIYYSRVPETALLPNFDKDQIVSFKSIDDIQTKDLRETVDKYMKDSHVSKFEKLKTFRRVAECLSGYPLYIDDHNLELPSHVLVFDGVRVDGSRFQNRNFADKVRRLSVAIETIISKY